MASFSFPVCMLMSISGREYRNGEESLLSYLFEFVQTQMGWLLVTHENSPSNKQHNSFLRTAIVL